MFLLKSNEFLDLLATNRQKKTQTDRDQLGDLPSLQVTTWARQVF